MVSIILPIFNAEPYLKACLSSVLRQSYEELEILLIDDGSTDASASICREFASRDSRIHLLHQENAGVSAARNRGLSRAKGTYVLFVDADDVLPPRAVEHLVQGMTPEVDLVIGSHFQFRGPLRKNVRRKPGRISREVFQEQWVQMDVMLSTVWGKLYRRSRIAENSITFSEDLSYCEDHLFNLHYCSCLHQCHVAADVIYGYRLGGEASSLRYHPNMAQMQVRLLEGYGMLFGGWDQVPFAFREEKCRELLHSSVMHELCHQNREAAIGKVREILTVFRPFLTSKAEKEEELVTQLCQRHRWKLILKKGKIALWRRFCRRI